LDTTRLGHDKTWTPEDLDTTRLGHQKTRAPEDYFLESWTLNTIRVGHPDTRSQKTRSTSAAGNAGVWGNGTPPITTSSRTTRPYSIGEEEVFRR